MPSLPDPRAVSCREMHEGLTEYLEGALLPQEQQGFDGHLASCRECRSLLDDLRATIHGISSTARPTLTDLTRQFLLDAFRRHRQR